MAGAGGAVSQPPLHTPLDVLRSFLATYAAFDWDADTLTALGAVPTTLFWMALPVAFSTLVVVPIVPFASLQRSRSVPPAAML